MLRKLIPVKVRHCVTDPLRKLLCPQFTNLLVAGKPGTQNPWWAELKAVANQKIFPLLSSEAKSACSEIRKAYIPVLLRYGVDTDDFFWGSIKNEEAEALYQLVLERKPDIAYQIGTFVGYSALVIAHAMRACGKGLLIAVDPEIPHRTFINPVNIAREVAQGQQLEKFIRFERGWHSGALGDYIGRGLKNSIPIVGPQLLTDIHEQGVDLAFIDGDHSSACTLTDYLLLKDYLNINGIAVFHDVRSWPTVAQAIFLLWHDIYYFVRGTSAYFGLDVREGQDGLAALERLRYEDFPTLCLKLVDNNENAVIDATVLIPSKKLHAITDRDGTVYFSNEINTGTGIQVTCNGYKDYSGLLKHGTDGGYVENTIVLSKG